MLSVVRKAFRRLWQTPGFTTLTVATLAIGIGSAAAMFGLINGALLSPPPYDGPDRLVLLTPARGDGQPYGRAARVAHWDAWKRSTTVEQPALYGWTFNFLVRPDGSESMGGMVVSTDYFKLLGVRPLLGRDFVAADASRPNTPPAAIILGYERWQRTFGGDPRVIGRTVQLSRMPAPLPVIAVMPPGLRFLPDPGAASEPNYDLDALVDFWFAMEPDLSRPVSGAGNAITRLRPDVAIERARAELKVLTADAARAQPELAGLSVDVDPLLGVLNGEGRALLLPLMGAVVLVFAIAVANVAGLLLAKGLQRQPEFQIRAALGAGRWRLFAQVIAEGIALALAGTVAGGILAAAFIALVRAVGGRAIPRVDAVSVGWPVVAAGLLAALVAAVLASLAPAFMASRSERLNASRRHTMGRGERRLLGGVAVLQIVLTVALLFAAALMVQTGRNLQRVQPGYLTEHILAMTVTAVQRDSWVPFHTQAIDRVAALPGVARAAFAWGLPLTGNKWPGEIELGGRPQATTEADRVRVALRAVSEDYFDALRMPLVEGRTFRRTDTQDAPRVAIVNEAFVARHWQSRHPLGQRFTFPGAADQPVEIVGVLKDVRTDSLGKPAEPEVYMPIWQRRAFSKHLVIRAQGDPLAIAALVRQELKAVDPTAAVEHVTTLEEIRRQSVAPQTFAMRLLMGFAVVATLLALIGLYGVVSLSVTSRTREMAVRAAVGATASEIAALVLRETGRLVVAGLLCGAVAAIGVGRTLQGLLYGVSAGDPLALAAAGMAFCVSALAVCLRPAWRAGRVDLTAALRQE